LAFSAPQICNNRHRYDNGKSLTFCSLDIRQTRQGHRPKEGPK
jgi:hypothetical protein